ncbi:MAG: rhomboid family intramembrane serine protease [Eubacterium sp.]|nr:rhomboid family intramembrane serine protease [Eubacterium sp.]
MENRYFSPCTAGLIIINAAVFLVMCIVGNPSDAEYMASHGAMWAGNIVEQGQWWTLITPIFLHFDLEHIVSNMLLLFFIGKIMEDALGPVRFLILYLVAGVAGNVLSLLVEMTTLDYVVSAGASGAVFGVLGGVLFEVLYHKGMYAGMSTRRLIFFILLSLYIGFSSSGINNSAHIGGLVTGFVLAGILTLTIRRPKSA